MATISIVLPLKENARKSVCGDFLGPCATLALAAGRSVANSINWMDLISAFVFAYGHSSFNT
jgi:hypothetical protein